jgi:putative oxidoreductase
MLSRISALVTRIYALLNRFEFVPILLARLALGVGFAMTGHGKLFGGHANVVELFTNLKIPMPELNAWFVSGLEFFGGILLVMGLGTRIIALMLSFAMLVAGLTAVFPKDGLLNSLLSTEVLAMLMLFWLVFSGPGPFSFDHLVAKKLAPPPPSKPAA